MACLPSGVLRENGLHNVTHHPPLSRETSDVQCKLLSEPIAFADALALERELLDSVKDSPAGTCVALAWRTPEAIIVPRGLPSRDYYAKASAAAQALGFTLHERDTGGDLTPQSEGIVNLSLAYRLDGKQASIADAYVALTDPVLAFLKQTYGIAARTASIPGAFCDGAYNVAIGDRKLAGTAQKWKLLGGEGDARRVSVLGHIALMATNELGPALDALNAFYEASGSDRRVIPQRHVTLADVIGRARADAAWVARDLSAFLSNR